MLLFVLAALAYTALRKRPLSGAIRDAAFLPFCIVELAYIVCQAAVFLGSYDLLFLSAYLQAGFILSLLYPILKHGLYRDAVIALALVLAGSILNRIAMSANGGAMPVYPTLSRITGYFSVEALAASGDARHVLMHSGTRLRFLCDWIDTGLSVMSPGDVLIHSFTTVVFVGLFRKRSEEQEG